MSAKAYNYKRTIDLLAETSMLTQDDAEQFHQRLLEEIRQQLLEGSQVELPGLGKFVVLSRQEAKNDRSPARGRFSVVFWPLTDFAKDLAASRGVSDKKPRFSLRDSYTSEHGNISVSSAELRQVLCDIWAQQLLGGVTVSLGDIGRLRYTSSFTAKGRSLSIFDGCGAGHIVDFESEPTAIVRLDNRGARLKRLRDSVPMLEPPSESLMRPRQTVRRHAKTARR